MKQLPLSNPAFISAERGFKEWLDILGYAAITVYNMPNAIREFLNWLEQREHGKLTGIDGDMIADYYQYLKDRPNTRRAGILSNAYLNKHQQAIKKFAEYLRYSLNIHFSPAELATEDVSRSKVDIMTVQEVHQLFSSTERLPTVKKGTVSPSLCEALQHRDRAMIAVFYGCGIRKNEAVQLDVSDINFHKKPVARTRWQELHGKNHPHQNRPDQRSFNFDLARFIESEIQKTF